MVAGADVWLRVPLLAALVLPSGALVQDVHVSAVGMRSGALLNKAVQEDILSTCAVLAEMSPGALSRPLQVDGQALWLQGDQLFCFLKEHFF